MHCAKILRVVRPPWPPRFQSWPLEWRACDCKTFPHAAYVPAIDRWQSSCSFKKKHIVILLPFDTIFCWSSLSKRVTCSFSFACSFGPEALKIPLINPVAFKGFKVFKESCDLQFHKVILSFSKNTLLLLPSFPFEIDSILQTSLWLSNLWFSTFTNSREWPLNYDKNFNSY